MMIRVKGDYTQTIDVRVSLRDAIKEFEREIRRVYVIPSDAYLSGDMKVMVDDEWRHGSVTSSVAVKNPTDEQIAAIIFIEQMKAMLTAVERLK